MSMTSFLQKFLGNEKTEAEKALLSPSKSNMRDQLSIEAYLDDSMHEDEDNQEDGQPCQKSCGGCGCKGQE